MARTSERPRVRATLLVLLWAWAATVFLVVDLFLNVPEFDGIRPRAPLYRAARAVAHDMVGEPLLDDAAAPLPERGSDLRDEIERLAALSPAERDALLRRLAERPEPGLARTLARAQATLPDEAPVHLDYARAAAAMVEAGRPPEPPLIHAAMASARSLVTRHRHRLDEAAWRDLGDAILRLQRAAPETVAEAPLLPPIRAALRETLAAAASPNAEYRGGPDAIRLAATLGDEAMLDLLIRLVRERRAVYMKLPLTSARDDLLFLEQALDAVTRSGTPSQRAALAQVVADALPGEDDPDARALFARSGETLAKDQVDDATRARLEAALRSEKQGG